MTPILYDEVVNSLRSHIQLSWGLTGWDGGNFKKFLLFHCELSKYVITFDHFKEETSTWGFLNLAFFYEQLVLRERSFVPSKDTLRSLELTNRRPLNCSTFHPTHRGA